MTGAASLCEGVVVHHRLRPRAHHLCYRVFSLLMDVDRIDEAAAGLKLFSRNAFNLVSFHDSDHGPGTAGQIGAHVRDALAGAGLADAGARILLLASPRVLGRVFNPLSVYFCHDAGGQLAALVYEVSNTFGERMSYVVAAGAPQNGVYAHGCRKELFVSPFTPGEGRYAFRVVAPGDHVVVGVQLRDADGALLRTHYRADVRPLTDGALLRASLRMPLLAAKVLGAIHLEAAKLWLKGVPLTLRHSSPRYSIAAAATRDAASANGSVPHVQS